MKNAFDHTQKYETEKKGSGRNRRNRTRSSARVHSGTVAGCGTPTMMAGVDSLGFKPGLVDEQPSAPGKISDELATYLRQHPALDATVQEALSTLAERLDEVELKAFLEDDPESADVHRVVIEVMAPMEDIDTYKALKSQVRGIVRAVEAPDTMLYTRITPKK